MAEESKKPKQEERHQAVKRDDAEKRGIKPGPKPVPAPKPADKKGNK